MRTTVDARYNYEMLKKKLEEKKTAGAKPAKQGSTTEK